MSTMDHVRYLAETIGPRGSTTPKEAEAARYAAQTLRQVGLEPTTETFSSARSGWHPFTLFSGAVLLSVALFWAAGRWGSVAALALSLLALASVLLELAFRPNPLRWVLPKGQSQNVWAKAVPRGSAREQVVLMGHLDSHRTPLAFSTDRWLRLFRMLIPLGLASVVFLIILFVIGVFSLELLWRWLSLPFTLFILGVFLLTLQADFTPYTSGANDNATGAAVVLSLAERLQREPLANTAVWAVLSGCEEVGCYGAEAFARAHKGELGNPAWITVDGVGGRAASPAYLDRETFLITAQSDVGLLSLADQAASRHADWGIQMRSFQGAYTEGSIGAKHGFRVLTVLTFREDGSLPEWHRLTDVFDRVDPEVVALTEAFLWELLQSLDRQATGGNRISV